jgi:hypothetical protein
MMNKILLTALSICNGVLAIGQTTTSQSDFDNVRNAAYSNYDNFKTKANENYELYRRAINETFADFMNQSWKDFEINQAIERPKKDNTPVVPVVYPVNEDSITPIRNKETPVTIVPNPIITVTPQPQPIVPIEPQPNITPIPEVEPQPEVIPQPDVAPLKTITINLFGTAFQFSDAQPFTVIGSFSTNKLADYWRVLSDGRYEGLLSDCLSVRKSYNLCDWAYLNLLQSLANTLCKEGSDESTLLMAFLYAQSGYRMRLGVADKHLVMLYASNQFIYFKPFFHVDGTEFYPFTDKKLNSMMICDLAFPQEQSMSLTLDRLPKLDVNASNNRKIQAKRYNDINCEVNVNINLINFFNSYPSSESNSNPLTRWALYAQTPFTPYVLQNFRDTIGKLIAKDSELTAVNKLLNFVQTGFPYEYDTKVWGYDRAFFAEETLYYPYCDCEDRSILFSRLVKDLLGLDVAIVYYPGHLATAVKFNEDVKGDYIMVNGAKFTICDPTYINAPVGRTMPDMDNATATAMQLH